MSVDLVNVETADGVRLDGCLWQPEAGAAERCALLVHGGGGNFYGPSYLSRVTRGLLGAGYVVLRVNTRGHDVVSTGPSGPASWGMGGGFLGSAYELLNDALYDFAAWIDFLAAPGGAPRVVLCAGSVGGVKALHYLAQTQDTRVAKAVCVSPPRLSYSTAMQIDRNDVFRSRYLHAEQMVASGAADGLMEVSSFGRLQTARNFLDKWGPGEAFNLVQLLPRVRVPVLLTVGSLEGQRPDSEDWYWFHGLPEQLAAESAKMPNLTFRTVEGANHSYVGRYEQLWELVAGWLHETA